MNNPYTVLVEGMVFAAGKSGLEHKFLLEKIPALSKRDLEDIIIELQVKYPNDGTSGIVLYNFGKVLSFVTHTSIGEQIADALKRKKQKELSTALLEVLAIIAYQQPITKAEVEQIREGRNCDYAIGALCEAALIEVKGRKDALGRPKLYGTTQNFLERFELKSIRSLPAKKEIEERIKVITLEAQQEEYLFRPDGDEDVTAEDVNVQIKDLPIFEEDDEPPVGAGEEGGYDDTDYDVEAAADETDAQDEGETDDLDDLDTYTDDEEVWDDSDPDDQ